MIFGKNRSFSPSTRAESLSPQTGEPPMANVLTEILLYSCVAAFVTGFVIAAASLIS